MELTVKKIQQIENEMLKKVIDICGRHCIDYFLAYGSVIGAVRHGGPIPWDPDLDIVVPYNQIEKFIRIARNELPNKFCVDYYDTNKSYPYLFPRVGLAGYSTFYLHIDIFPLIGLPRNIQKQVQIREKLNRYSQIFFRKNYSQHYIGFHSYKRSSYYLFYKILHLPMTNKFIKKQFGRVCQKYPYKDAKFVLNATGGYGEKEVLPKSFYGSGSKIKYSDIEITIPERWDAYLQHFYGDYMQPPPEDAKNLNSFFEIIHQ
jgi:lipopolysaccharide cholinephosphotransferase